MILKKYISPVLYKELRYAYRQYFVFWHPLLYWKYLYSRLFVRPKIRLLQSPLDRAPGETFYTIHLLCSHGDMNMLLWSLASWHKVVESSGKIFIHEDGSFTDEDRALVARLLPHATLVDMAISNKKAEEEWLKDLPHARGLRKNYKKHILIVKLIDPFFTSNAPQRLILDTDLLWFQKPEEVLKLLQENHQPFFQYGSPAPNQEFNSGICGYDAKDFTPHALEAYSKNPDPMPHFIEQSGYVSILKTAGKGLHTLDKEAYTVRKPVGEQTVLKHYTGPRREEMTLEGMGILKKRILR